MIIRTISTGSKYGNGYVLDCLDREGSMLMLDCGFNPKKLMEGIRYSPSKVSGCLVSHKHKDHVNAHWDLSQLGIQIIAPEHFFDRAIVVKERKLHELSSGWSYISFEVPHDGTTNWAYIIYCPDGNRVLYATDFQYIPFSLAEWSINYMIVECNHISDLLDSERPNFMHSVFGHSELETVKELVRHNKTEHLKGVYLCHLSEYASDDLRMQNEIQEIAGTGVDVVCLTAGMELEVI